MEKGMKITPRFIVASEKLKELNDICAEAHKARKAALKEYKAAYKEMEKQTWKSK